MVKLFKSGASRWMALTLLAGAVPAAAIVAPPTTLPYSPSVTARARMLDVRVDPNSPAMKARQASAAKASASARRSLSAMAAAAVELKRTVLGLEVRLDSATGAPSEVRNRRGSLTDAAPGVGSEKIVRDFLGLHGDLYGLSSADLNDLVALGDSAGGYSGLRMLRMEQQIDGRPVFGSETRFLLDRQGRLMESLGLMVPNARSVAAEVDAAKRMPPAKAVSLLLASAGRTAAPSAFQVTAEKAGGRFELSEDDSFVAGPITAREVLFPLAPGVLVPAWSLVVFTTGDQDWYAVVDAETGDLLWRKDMRDYASTHEARFRVYVQADGRTPADSPAPQSPSTAAPGAGTQYPEIAPTIVNMSTAQDIIASPNGWIDDCPGGGCTANETQTIGNNTVTCLDQAAPANVCDTGAATVLDGNGRPTGNPDGNGRNRDFLGTAPRDFQTNYLPPPQGGNPEAGQTATGNGTSGTAPIDQFRRGVVTHLFYLTNWYHDQLYRLGFDEASANFQQTNFTGMGVGNDRVLGDAADGSGTDNANFSTPPDGTSGRMQMFRFIGPTIDRDGSLDSEIVLHELSHGTSNRLVGNGTGLAWDPARGMGEGWSDFYAMALLNNTATDSPDANYASGAYATYKLNGTGLLDNYVYGIRRFPYSTVNTINPMTWADVDDVTNDLSGGITPTPVTFNLGGGMEVHNSGELWALSLWEMRSRIIADPAGANGNIPTGNRTSLQLVTDGLKMTPVHPTFVDARDALLRADCTTNACANEDWIWGAFSDRGLGYRAQAPYKVIGRYVRGHEGIDESFSLPYLDVANPLTDVTVNDTAGNNNGAIDPGEPVLLTVRLTNPWRRATRTVASATAVLTTSTPGVTILDGNSTYAAIVPQGTATGDTFSIRLTSAVPCGSSINFTLTTTSSLGTTAATFSVRVGTRSGTASVVTYTGTPNSTIVNNRPRGVFHQINVTDDFEIADIDFRINSITHPAVGDLTALLRSPAGVGNDLIALIDGLNDLGGTAITNMVIDDDVTNNAANDMVQATTAASPYTKSWRPVYNSPWAALVNPTFPAETATPDLSRYDGTSTLGTWTALVSDVFSAAGGGADGNGTFGSWSILVTPVQFTCSPFVAIPVITATKTVAGSFAVGGSVTYTVTINNTGAGDQGDNTGDEFTDTVPAGLTVTTVSATTGTAANTGNNVTWNGTIVAGTSVTITINATVNAGTQGTTISNQGTVNYDADGNGTNEATLLTDDPGQGGATDPTSFTVSSAMVTGTKTASGTFTVGGTVTYTIVLSNSGNTATPDNAGNELSDAVPSGLTVTNATATSGTAAFVGNNVTWNGSIPAGGSVTITITATVNAGTQGTTISNQASFAYDADFNGSNESSGTTDDPSAGGANDPTQIVIGAAAVTATKTASGTFLQGSTVTYTVTLSNSGASATADNAGNEFTDSLSASLVLVSATATSGVPVANVGTNTVTWNGAIPAGGSVTITITATIVGAAGTTVNNQGTVLYDADVNGSNETTVLTDDPAVGGAADPTTFVIAGGPIDPTEIPTLGEWGMILLSLSLALAAWSVLRRRQTQV